MLQALVLGLVQGLTEFLPVSSSAHLLLVPRALGWPDPGAAFTAVTQLGTETAVLLYFRHDLLRIAAGWLHGWRSTQAREGEGWRLGWVLIIGTVPIGLAGLLLEPLITGPVRRNLVLIATALIVVGILLAVVDRFATGTRTVGTVTWREAVLLGLAQAAALCPGVSRSGATVSAALALGLDRASATRLSFLLAVPAVVLSGLFTLPDVLAGDGPGLGATAAATVVAFVVGYGSIAGLLRFVTRHSFAVFAGYRVLLGVGVLLAVAVG